MEPIQQQIHHDPQPSEMASNAGAQSAKQRGVRSAAVAVPEKEAALDENKTGLRPGVLGLIAAFLLLSIIGVILGGVFGARAHNKANRDSSQSSSTTSADPTSASSTSSTSSAPTNEVLDPSMDDVLSGTSLTSTFTYYGSGDRGNTPNCSISPMPCGLLSKVPSKAVHHFFFMTIFRALLRSRADDYRTKPGYTAAVSENLFGSLALGKDSPVCGTCWRLDAEVDSSDRILNKTIVVMVNNICPAQGNPLCSQPTLHDKNEWGAAVDFNLCSDSGAADELFGRGTGVGLAVGRATRVDCKEWSGEIVRT